MNIARVRGLAEALIEPPVTAKTEEGVHVQISTAAVGREIIDALAWREDDEFAAVQRVVGALVGKYGARLSEETEEQARILVFVALAGISR